MPGLKNFSSVFLWTFITVCSARTTEEPFRESVGRGQETATTDRIASSKRPIPSHLEGSRLDSEEGTIGHGSQGRNLTQAGLSALNFMTEVKSGIAFPKSCSYGNKQYQCALGAACLLQNMKPMDLCGGGLIWACCVPRTNIPEKPDNNMIGKAECGKTYLPQSRIIGGESANFGQYPWQVALVKRGLFTERIYCGGALISEKYVLTAAHCVQRILKFQLKVRLGEHNIMDTSDLYPHEEYGIEETIIHPRYDSSLPAYDIALLRLAKSVNFREHIVPICLPQQGARFDGKMATVSGWGTLIEGAALRPPKLQKVDVPVIDDEICRQWFLAHDRTAEIHNSMMCAGFEDGGKDACQGDSGGPLILINGGRAQLIGIVSWGIKCGRPKLPGVYTRVSDYVDWINEIVGKK